MDTDRESLKMTKPEGESPGRRTASVVGSAASLLAAPGTVAGACCFCRIWGGPGGWLGAGSGGFGVLDGDVCAICVGGVGDACSGDADATPGGDGVVQVRAQPDVFRGAGADSGTGFGVWGSGD